MGQQHPGRALHLRQPADSIATWTCHPLAQTLTVNSPSGPKCLDLAYGFYDPGTGAATAGASEGEGDAVEDLLAALPGDEGVQRAEGSSPAG